MANLVELFDNVVEFQNYNGVPLAAGKLYVYALGRTRLMDTWSDVDGESLNPNPIILDDLGQCHCYCSDDFDYTLVICDQYDNEIFSIDKYLYSKGSHSHADVAVAPSETIAVSSYHVGETTVYVPYLTGQLGKVYQGIEPIVVNNTEDKISANHVPLGVQDPLYFVQDDEEGCIIGFSGQTIPEDVMSESALGFENNKITGYNGSAFSAGNEYEAGNYISIDNNTINVVNLPTSADVQNIVDVATSGLMPSGDYLTKESADTLYAPTGNYLTGLPDDLVYTADITGLATTAELDNKLDKSDSGNFYPMDSNPSGYLTGLPSDLATTGWVDSQGYLTAVDIPESAVWNATTQTVSANSAQWAGGTANPQIPVTGINGIKISESGDKVVFEVSGDYYTNDNPSGFITGVDLSDYATTAELADKQDITGMTAYQPVGNYQTAGDYLTTADSANFYTTANESGFITGVDLTPYQLTADMTAYQPTGDYLTTADSANFYTTANESGFITGVPDTYLQNTDLSTTDGKVTAISGIPLSAGGDVPEGVMVESGLEYNAVQEISGYNGSAIAQYGAEKQWLVHDDTLVHAANSAQYALGVNLSAVAQLLGVDETVLYSGDNTTAAAISEPLTAFNSFEIYYYFNDGFIISRKYSTNTNLTNLPIDATTLTGTTYFSKYGRYSANDTTVIKVYAYDMSNFNVPGTNSDVIKISKIIGIGRKS